jgi:hypothetical protein
MLFTWKKIDVQEKEGRVRSTSTCDFNYKKSQETIHNKQQTYHYQIYKYIYNVYNISAVS